MLVPVQEATFAEHLRWCTEIYHRLGEVLTEKGHDTTVGDEGGYAPHVKSDQEAIEFLLTAIDRAGYKAGTQIAIALDPAASQFWQPAQQNESGKYALKIHQKNLS